MLRRWIGCGVAAALLGAGGGSAAWAQARRDWTARTSGLAVPVNRLGVRTVKTDGRGSAFVLTETLQTGNAQKRDFLVIKVGPTGAVVWNARYNGPGNDNETPIALAVSPTGDVVATGTSQRGGTGEDAAAKDIVTVQFDGATGSRKWAARYVSAVTGASSSVRALAIDAQGGVFVGGATVAETDQVTNSDILLVKYSPEQGSQVWSRKFNGAANKEDYFSGLALDSAGDAYITGEVTQPLNGYWGSPYDAVTVKYQGATGATVWSALFNTVSAEGSAGNDAGISVAVDSARGVAYMTGVSFFNDFQATTVQYNAATGAQNWARVYEGPRDDRGDDPDDASGAAIPVTGADSGVYVLGRTTYNGRSAQGLLLKYSFEGALLWSLIDNTRPIDFYNAELLADGKGGLFVIAKAPSSYATNLRKFDATTGATLGDIKPPNGYLSAALEPDGTLRILHSAPDNESDITADLQVSKYTPYARAVDLAAAGLATDPQKNTLIVFTRADGKYEVWRVAPSGAVEARTIRDAPPGGFSPFAAAPLGARDIVVGMRSGSSLYHAILQGGGPLLKGLLDTPTSSENFVPLDIVGHSSRQVTAAWASSGSRIFKARTYTDGFSGFSGESNIQPLADLAPFAMSVGWGDKQMRFAWVNRVNGAVTLWKPDGQSPGPATGKVFAAPAGYKLTDMSATGSDNKIRLLWTRQSDNAVAVWQLKADMSGVEWGKIYGPYPGARAVKITVGTGDNQTRVLWNYDTGKTALWTLGPSGEIVRGVLFPAF